MPRFVPGDFSFLFCYNYLIVLIMNNLHRIFVAIGLPERLRKDLFAVQGRYAGLPANWTKPENLHVTLVFFGNANDQEVSDICLAVKEVAKRHDPFDVMLDRVIYGPEQKFPPRMVWAVGEKSGELGALQVDLERAFYGSGRQESYTGGDGPRALSPHVTLARIRQFDIKRMEPEEIPAINETMEGVFMAESVEVMESELKRGGPAYTVLESAKLGE